MHIKEEIKCPNCNKKNRIKIIKETTSDFVSSIVTREFFTKECKYCGEKIVLDYPLKIVGDDYLVYYTPGSNTEIEGEEGFSFLRVCDTFDDLKEKLLIFEDGLDDFVIEFIKDFLFTQLDNEIRKDVLDMRYDGANEENLIFYLLGVKKSIGCSRVFYNELLKKSKRKRVNKCIVVDKESYKKYFKLR